MASLTKDLPIIAAVACPRCGAHAGQPCQNPVPHQQHRGDVDHRRQPARPHSERKRAWQDQRP